jgi:hypothetical protein
VTEGWVVTNGIVSASLVAQKPSERFCPYCEDRFYKRLMEKQVMAKERRI